MGTFIALTVGNIELSWAKNMPGSYHGDLFLESDRKKVPDPLGGGTETFPAFQSTLCKVLPRIELLGHTLERARQEYDYLVERAVRRDFDLDGESKTRSSEEFLTFDSFLEIVRTIPANDVSTELDYEAPNPKRLCSPEMLKKLPWYNQHQYEWTGRDPGEIISEATSVDFLVDGFHSYTQIRLLAENVENSSSHVTWMYGPLVANGWAYEDEFQTGLSDRETFLIVTEGSSDAKIIRHAFNVLRPQIRDFFRYVDMEDEYPFSGTGNLRKFVQGLAALRVPLNVVALFDNDAEGVAMFEKTRDLKLPQTYSVQILPDLPALEQFPTNGPTGASKENINGRAAAIECYLDLTRGCLPQMEVEWGAKNNTLDRYQGELLGKTQAMKDFLNYKGEPDKHGAYDTRKLEAVLDVLQNACVLISSKSECSAIRNRAR